MRPAWHGAGGWGPPALLLAACAALACGGTAGPRVQARKAVLEREIDGLRELVASLEKGEPLLPRGDLVVAVDERLVRDLLDAELPFQAEVDRFRVRLERADVSFRGKYSLVTLEGAVESRDNPSLAGELRVYGGVDRLELDPSSGTLRAAVALDHLDFTRAAGLENLLSARTLDSLSQRVRQEVTARIPTLEIPVQLQQSIELPALTEGPVLVGAARVPLRVAVSRVLAIGGRLWAAFHVEPGEFEKLGTSEASGS